MQGRSIQRRELQYLAQSPCWTWNWEKGHLGLLCFDQIFNTCELSFPLHTLSLSDTGPYHRSLLLHWPARLCYKLLHLDCFWCLKSCVFHLEGIPWFSQSCHKATSPTNVAQESHNCECRRLSHWGNWLVQNLIPSTYFSQDRLDELNSSSVRYPPSWQLNRWFRFKRFPPELSAPTFMWSTRPAKISVNQRLVNKMLRL